MLVLEGARNDGQACVPTLTGKATDAIRLFATGVAFTRTAGTAIWKPLHRRQNNRTAAGPALFASGAILMSLARIRMRSA